MHSTARLRKTNLAIAGEAYHPIAVKLAAVGKRADAPEPAWESIWATIIDLAFASHGVMTGRIIRSLSGCCVTSGTLMLAFGTHASVPLACCAAQAAQWLSELAETIGSNFLMTKGS